MLTSLLASNGTPAACGSVEGLAGRLRICHLGKYYPPAAGGIESHLQTLAREQAACGAQVSVICANSEDRLGRDVTGDPLAATPDRETWDGPVRLIRCGRWGNLAKLDICPSTLRFLRRLTPANTDIVHLHTPNPTMLLAWALVRPPVPLVITHHSDVVRQRFLGKVQRPVEHLVYRRARRILTSSPCYAAASDLLRSYQDRVEPLPFGIALEPFLNPSPEALQVAARLRERYRQPLWLSVGRLVYYKGLDTAVRALRHVPGTYLIIGQGPLEQRLKARAAAEGVADRVVWQARASQDELVGAYHAATALWFPSCARSEGFGLVQVEAMACGCPVINTALAGSGVPWVSRHEETGLTVPVGDAQALAQAARRLHEDADLRQRLGRQARLRAQTEFSARLMAQRSLLVYRQVLAQR
jgi:rhamnosyl/mannosyltransferase